MKKITEKYEDIPLSSVHYIECVGNKSLLVDNEYMIRVIKESKQEVKESVDSKFKGDSYYDRMASDKDALREIELFAENDGDLYRQSFQPMIKNMKSKINNNTYNHALAPKLWLYYVEGAMKKYAREFGGNWSSLLSTKDRMILATKLADNYYDEIVINKNY